jgi:hypothetical protein
MAAQEFGARGSGCSLSMVAGIMVMWRHGGQFFDLVTVSSTMFCEVFRMTAVWDAPSTLRSGSIVSTHQVLRTISSTDMSSLCLSAVVMHDVSPERRQIIPDQRRQSNTWSWWGYAQCILRRHRRWYCSGWCMAVWDVINFKSFLLQRHPISKD